MIIIFSGPSSQLEDIFNTVDRLQQLRFDDQRTTFPSPTNHNNNNNNIKAPRLTTLNEQFFDQLAKSQVSLNI